jgi:hypothetical protein
MKYEGQQYSNVPPDVPGWFKDFLSHYAIVIKFLTEFNVIKFTMGRDINLGPTNKKVSVQHGIITNIPHNLSVQPTRAIFSGRVQATNILGIDSKSVRVMAKLLTTRVISKKNNNTLLVEDSTLFRVGDSVVMNAKTYRIVNVNGDSVTFASVLPNDTIHCMILSQDTLEVTIF